MADVITQIRTNTNGNHSPLATPILTPINSKLLREMMESNAEPQGDCGRVETPDAISPETISQLTHDELVAQLLKARQKITELENARSVDEERKSAQNSCDLLPGFEYSSDDGNLEEHSWERASHDVIQELQDKFRRHSNFADSFVFRPSKKNEDFVIAYEHKGDFPDCDEDLTLETSEEDSQLPRITIQDGMWDRDDDDSSSDDFGSEDEIEEFPLIPSPVLNTPPYEYIFLTKENEAKFRIFLNPKLNKVFQEEVNKMKAQEDRYKQLHIAPPLPCPPHDQNFMDLHNQNHIINSSHSEMEPLRENTMSASNVIHCFDPSDVDLELKKIFTEKPPITHKIVRRKTRKERGSSVPAVDSYYGTRDLNKVGHASYFIPMLTESERKAIGWKPDYHYGHWKYAHFNVPNVRTNPISLHPHPHPDSDEQGKKGCVSRHHHSYHHCKNQSHHHTRPLLSQNPLHQKEINLSEVGFLLGSEAQSLLESPTSPADRSQSLKHSRDADDPLSFITLSRSPDNPSETSCHIIPDACALKRILRWLLPSCMKAHEINDKSSLISSHPDDNCGHDSEFEKCKLDQSLMKKNHEIETLVEPSSRLAFTASDTNVSFTSLETKDDRKEKANANNNNIEQPHHHPHFKNTSPEYKHHSEHHPHHHNNHHHHNHHSHHHHHGFFHWKHIVNHGSSTKSQESMSVVGGDVVDSGNASSTGGCGAIQLLNVAQEDMREVGGVPVADSLESSSEDSDIGISQEETKLSQPKRKHGKRLKQCKAFEKLLTLKDLGYESEEAEFGMAHERLKLELEALEIKETTPVEVEWTCPIVL